MSDTPSSVRFEIRRLDHWLVYGFGTGLMPKAPGTWGTLPGVALFLLLAHLSVPVYITLTALLFVLGIWVCGRVGKELGVHDHGSIVWDEVVGYLITMTAVPADWPWVIAGFALFRLFDILKPWPIGWVDRRVTGGLGVMLDDVLAGVMAWAVLQAALRVVS